MANDGSMASLVEEWIAVQLRGLDAFDDNKVEPYEGTMAQGGQPLIEELLSKASPAEPYAAVLFEGDRPIPLEEGAQAYEPTYAIYVVGLNARPGAARKGDGTIIGTNGLRDAIRTALHDKLPNIGTGGFYTDFTRFNGARVVFQRTDAFILRAELVVRESPSA